MYKTIEIESDENVDEYCSVLMCERWENDFCATDALNTEAYSHSGQSLTTADSIRKVVEQVL